MRGFFLVSTTLFIAFGLIASESPLGSGGVLHRSRRQVSGKVSAAASTGSRVSIKADADDDAEGQGSGSTPAPEKKLDKTTKNPKDAKRDKKVDEDIEADDEEDERGETEPESTKRPRSGDRPERGRARGSGKRGRESRVSTRRPNKWAQDDDEDYEDCRSRFDGSEDDDDDDEDYGLVHNPMNGFSRLMGSMMNRMKDATSDGKANGAKAFSVSNGDGSSRSRSSVTTGGRTRGVELEVRNGRSKIRRFDNKNEERDDDGDDDY